MTYRRTFLKQLGTVAGVSAFGRLLDVQEAFAAQLPVSALDESNSSSYALLRERYMLDSEITYFNHGSIGTIPRLVHEAHVGYLRVCESNPWLYMWGGEWEEPRARVREKAAATFGCDPADMCITHNTTEGFSTVANGLALGPGDEVVFSSLNHSGAGVCWYHNAPLKGFTVKEFEFPVLDVRDMSVDDVLNLYDQNISSSTRVLVLPHIDNVVGLVHPVKEIAQLARDKGVEIVAVDGAQSVGMLELNVSDLGVDLYCASPHKWLQSPKGLGLMYMRRELQDAVHPMWVTWGQARWRDSIRKFEDYGTRNLPELITLGDAIDFQLSLGTKAKVDRYQHLWEVFRAAALESDHVIWRSPDTWPMSASLFAVEVRDKVSTEVSQSMYQDYGFVFRPFRTQGLNTLRISPNVYNTEDEIARFFELTARL